MLSGLRLARQMGADTITTLTDLRLAVHWVNGEFEARDKRMEKYIKVVQILVEHLNKFTIKQIPRGKNRRANALNKLASTCFGHLSKKVLVEVLKERSIDEQHVHTLTPTRCTWMTPIIEYLQHSILPDSHEEVRNVRIKAPLYTIMEWVLYQKGFMTPWLKCID